MKKTRVLFVCIHNSARSQMAEAFVKAMAGDRFEAESAGIEPGSLNPVVVEVMKEIGIDISGNRTKSVYEVIESGRTFDYVITVCDETSAEQCPVFPGADKRLHWSFEDPSAFTGDHDEKVRRTKEVRDRIRARVKEWLEEMRR